MVLSTLAEIRAANPIVTLSIGTSDGIGQTWWMRHESSGIARSCMAVVDPSFRLVLMQLFMAAGPVKQPRRGIYTSMEFKAELLPLLGFGDDQVLAILQSICPCNEL